MRTLPLVAPGPLRPLCLPINSVHHCYVSSSLSILFDSEDRKEIEVSQFAHYDLPINFPYITHCIKTHSNKVTIYGMHENCHGVPVRSMLVISPANQNDSVA